MTTLRFPNMLSSISTVRPKPPIFLVLDFSSISSPITSLQHKKLLVIFFSLPTNTIYGIFWLLIFGPNPIKSQGNKSENTPSLSVFGMAQIFPVSLQTWRMCDTWRLYHLLNNVKMIQERLHYQNIHHQNLDQFLFVFVDNSKSWRQTHIQVIWISWDYKQMNNIFQLYICINQIV